jgi:hypothetical protein
MARACAACHKPFACDWKSVIDIRNFTSSAFLLGTATGKHRFEHIIWVLALEQSKWTWNN